MKTVAAAALLGFCSLVAAAQSADGMFATGAVTSVLDGFHAAAAAADEEKYFAALAPDAVFLGTDATERWTKEEFRKFAHPYFAKGKAWTYKAKSRWISFAPDRQVAWFDELLESPHLGTCRGSGVLVSLGGTWKIVQYNLSIPIPNALADSVTKQIAENEKGSGLATTPPGPAPTPKSPKEKP
ncbi:MAG TPA: nuclear transport factor 2 family protein [Thermoanaerobaculia bacterium]|jgi:hypothetical protein